MSEKIVNFIVGMFGSFTTMPFIKEVIVFLISMCPILELRGGLIAASLLGMDPWLSYIVCMIGNIIPIPLILWLINKILNINSCEINRKEINKMVTKAGYDAKESAKFLENK